LGNAGTIISFRVGAEDASYIVQEFHERYEKMDFLQLPNFSVYLKIMIDGMPPKPFSAVTLAPTSRNAEELALPRGRLRNRELRFDDVFSGNEARSGWF
jgi:hypothetical protein